MLVFLYKQRIEQIWDGWLTVSTHFSNGHVSSLGTALTREQRWNAQFSLLLFPLSCLPVVFASELVATLLS